MEHIIDFSKRNGNKKDLSFTYIKQSQQLKMNLFFSYNRNQVEEMLEITFCLKEIKLNGSIFPFKAKIPFLFNFSQPYSMKNQTFLISQNETKTFKYPLNLQIDNVLIMYLPFSQLIIERPNEFLNNSLFLPFLFSFFDVAPISSLHYFDERRLLLSMKMRLNTADEITKEMISDLHNAIFPSHEYDESQIENLSLIEMKTLTMSVSSRYFSELGLSFKILQEIPSAVRESRNKSIPNKQTSSTTENDDLSNEKDTEILIYIPPSQCSIIPSLIYGNQQFDLVTALKIDKNELVNIYYNCDKQRFYEIRKDNVFYYSGFPSPADNIIALAYRCYDISRNCIFNTQSFIDRYEKVNVYSIVHQENQSIGFKSFFPNFNAPIFSMKTMDCDELRCMTNEYFFYEYDPNNNNFPISPLPSICGKSLLMLPKSDRPHLLWSNMIYFISETDHSVSVNNPLCITNQNSTKPKENEITEQSKLFLSELYLPITFKRPIDSARNLVEILNLKEIFTKPFILASIFNNQIIKIYKPDEQINFALPSLVLIALDKYKNQYAIPYLLSSLLNNAKLESQQNSLQIFDDSLIPYLNHPNDYILNNEILNSPLNDMPLYFSILSKPKTPFYLFRYYLSYNEATSLENRIAIAVDKLITTFKVYSNKMLEDFSFLANYFTYEAEADTEFTIELLNGSLYLVDIDINGLDTDFDLFVSTNGKDFYNVMELNQEDDEIPKYRNFPICYFRILTRVGFKGFPDFKVTY